MPLMLLANLQRAGNRPIVLMGGGTGLIGDPSGKSSERPLLSKEQIRENVRRQRDQSARFLEFGTGAAAALVLDNAKWLGEQKLIDFLRDVGKHFTVNVMMQKESVKARMESGLSFTEFSYMLLQAYDFLHLYRERQCTLQVAGSDQWGNITAGVELIRRVENVEVHGLVAPLVTRASGQKFGKTETGAVYLDPEMTSPYKFYQFWINVDDRDVENYLKLFTLKSRDEITALLAEHTRDPATRAAQRALAADITTRVHGADTVKGVVSASAILFGDEESRDVDPAVFEILAQEIPTATLAAEGAPLVDAVISAGLAKSKNEARRAIEQGGIYLNQQRVEDVGRTLGPGDWIAGRNVLLRKGKKEYALLRKER
jgi:tyrosyl-tRNA synthetase